jgi:hypothetical protein
VDRRLLYTKAQHCIEKFVEKLLAESDIEAVLQRLDRLTPEESQMTVTQTLEVILGLVENVKIIMNGVRCLHCLAKGVQLRYRLGRWNCVNRRYLTGSGYTFTRSQFSGA